MRNAAAAPPIVPCDPDVDENGVDLAQVRAMLGLAPVERLSRMTAFISSLLEIRARNGEAGPR